MRSDPRNPGLQDLKDAAELVFAETVAKVERARLQIRRMVQQQSTYAQLIMVSELAIESSQLLLKKLEQALPRNSAVAVDPADVGTGN
jgi:hypothetical protein